MPGARAARPASAAGRVLVAAALLAIIAWRPGWVRVAASWYLGRVQAFAAGLAGSPQLKAALTWYFSECQALGGLIARSMLHH
jgi:hypothetical protein